MRSPWTAAVAAPLALLVFSAAPASAADCVKTNPVFSPGRWVSSSLHIGGQDDDGISTINLYADGSFSLLVDDHGQASGGLELSGGSGTVMNDTTDLGHAETAFTIEAQLTGTGSMVHADGEQNVQMSGEVDVSGGDGKGLAGTNTDELPDFGNNFSREWKTTFTPTSASCGQAIGTFGGGQLEYNDDGTLQETSAGNSPPVWYAYKVGKSTAGEDLESQFVELMADAEAILNADPIDTDSLSQFILDMLAFDSVLSSAEYCDGVDLGGLSPGNPAYSMLQSVMFNMMHTFLSTAAKGAYNTADVIYVANSFLQSTALGWRAPNGECIGVGSMAAAAYDVFLKLEDILIDRYKIARDADSVQEMAMIAAAAYQYGMGRLIEEVNK